MAKPYTETIDTILTWLNDTNRISENLGDPASVYTADGSYTDHNTAYPSYLINTGSYTHPVNEYDAIVLALNDLNNRKVKRDGDIITGNLRINQSLIVDTDVLIQGGDLISSAASFNVLNTPTTIYAFNAATTLGIGAGTGTTTINNDLAVNGGDITSSAATFNLVNSGVTTLNIGGAATAITIGNANNASKTTIRHDLGVDGNDLTSASASFNLLNEPTTINAFGAATSLYLGNANNASVTYIQSDLQVQGNDITSTQTNLAVFNTTSTTVDAFGAATTLNLGAVTGTTTVRNSLIVQGGAAQSFIVNDGTTTQFSVDSTNGNTIVSGTLSVTGDVAINTNKFTVAAATGNTLVAGTLSVTGDVAINTNKFNVIAASGNTTIAGTLGVTGNVTLTGDVAVNGADVTTSALTFNLIDATATTINFGRAANIVMGATTGTTTIQNATTILTGDLRIDGGDITTNTASTANVFNTGTVTTLNMGTSATAISLGAATGTTTINHSLLVKGGAGQTFVIDDGTTSKFSVDSTNGNTIIAGTLNVTGGLTFSGNMTVSGDVAINGGDLTSTQTTFNLLAGTATTVNFANAATTLTIGNVATAAQTVNMFTASTGASTYNFATGATAAATTKTLNIGTGGAASSTTNINLGSSNGGTIQFNAPNLKISTTSNGIMTASGGNGTIGVLTTANANRYLVSAANAVPVWSTATIPSTIAADRILYSSASNTLTETQLISSDSTISITYNAGQLDLKTTGNISSSINADGDLTVGRVRAATYSQTGTTVTVTLAGHNLTNGYSVFLDFTSGGVADGYYTVTVVTADSFTVQAASQSTSGNVDVYVGGFMGSTKVMHVGVNGTVPTSSAIYGRAYHASQVTKLIELEDASGSDMFTVDTSGNTVVTGNLSVKGNITNTGSSGAVVTQGIVEDPVTTTSTTEATILSVSATTYRSIEYQIQVTEGTKYWTYKILAIHDGTNANFTQYGMAGIGAEPVNFFAVDVVAGNLVLKATSISASSTVYKVVATAIYA